MIDFKEIEHIFTHVTKQELGVLHNLTKNNKSDFCVEIGSYMGASSIAISSALKKGEILNCIDIWKSNISMRPDPQQIDNKYEQNRWIDENTTLLDVFKYNTQKYSSYINIIKGYSNEVVKLFSQNKKIDILFIDGDHSYEGVKKDWENYYPLMNKNGIVIFHDFAWKSISRLLNESVLDKTYNYDNFPNMWWGYIL